MAKLFAMHTLWGCPAYALEPRLTSAGGKIPKWQPRSRRGQCLGVSPVHAESIGLIRNLRTGFISPQHHVVYDDWFETVCASADSPPPSWDHLCVFQRFEIVFDAVPPPTLADEWLTPEEIEQNRHYSKANPAPRRRVWQDVRSKEARDDFTFEPPPPPAPREPPDLPLPSSSVSTVHSPAPRELTRRENVMLLPTREQSFASTREPTSASTREPTSASTREPSSFCSPQPLSCCPFAPQPHYQS